MIILKPNRNGSNIHSLKSTRYGTGVREGAQLKAKGEELILRKTPGGIPIIVDRLSYSRAAALAVYISVGSRDEPQSKCGIAHMLEHLLFKGTELRTAKQIAQEIEAAGGELNGYTSKELTSYFISTLDETLETAQNILAEIISRPLLDAKDVKTEKKVVIQEIKMAEDDPDNYIHELLARAIWKGNPMSKSEGGEVDCVLPLSLRMIQDFYRSYYRPPHMAVVATGNVDADQIVTWAAKSFDEMPKATRRVNRKTPQFHPGIELFPREGNQVYAAIGFPGVKASHPDRYAQNLLSTVLASGTSSRLYQKVREENGLVYSIYSMSIALSDCGVLGTFFSTSFENADKVFRLVSEEMRKFKDQGLEKGELTRAKRWIKGMIVRKLEPVENRMFFLGEVFLQSGKLMTGAQILEQLEKVTEEDVERIAQTMFNQGKHSIALNAPKKEGRALSKELESLDF